MKEHTTEVYRKILAISKRTAIYNAIQSLLDWDQETYMPAEAVAFRAMQKEAMASLVHQEKTSKEFSEALNQLIDLSTGKILATALTAAEQASLREWRRDYLQNSKLPNAFVKTWTTTTAQATAIWQKAKQENDFASFSPYLSKIVELNRQKAEFLGYETHPYDALLALYEPDTKTTLIDTVFSRLKKPLREQLQSIMASPAYGATLADSELINKKLPVDKQWQFAQILLQGLGFQNSSSRLDESGHPFCMRITPHDVRMTTKVVEDGLMDHIFAVLHEAGHGIYGEGLPKEHYGSPLGEDVSLGIHESQSRWWETRIGQSQAFWQHYYPKLQAYFPDPFQDISLAKFYRLIHVVRPSLIRIYADEVTYNLHIILRFELEKALIEGQLQVNDLPDAWNAKMQEYLGLGPKNDAEGCLQDIHWSMGAMGYFPTYALGNLYAAQFFKAFENQQPDWKARVAKGELIFIREWLKTNIHQYGRQYTPQEIVQRVTGAPLSEVAFLSYLQEKYTHIYSK